MSDSPEPRKSSFIDGTDLIDSLLDESSEDDLTNYCWRVVHPETLEGPPEYCDEPAVEGADYCEYHLEEE